MVAVGWVLIVIDAVVVFEHVPLTKSLQIQASVLDSPAKALRRPTYLGQSQDEASAKSLGKIVAGKEGLRPPSIRKAPEIVKRDTIKISDVEEQKAIDKEY